MLLSRKMRLSRWPRRAISGVTGQDIAGAGFDPSRWTYSLASRRAHAPPRFGSKSLPFDDRERPAPSGPQEHGYLWANGGLPRRYCEMTPRPRAAPSRDKIKMMSTTCVKQKPV